LIKEWTWVLLIKDYDRFDALTEIEMYKTLGTFVMTFPYETQKEIILDWMSYYTDAYEDPFQERQNLQFMKIHEDWLASLEKEINSLQP